MKTLTLCALALLMAACSGCDEREESGEFRVEVRSVTFEPRPDDPAKYQALVELRVHGASVVQEVWSLGVHRWTEHIAIDEWREDWHRVYQGEHREIVTTPASVEGNAPNEYGTSLLWVEPGLSLGPEMAGMPVQGTITKRDDSRAIKWSIECLADGARVTIDGRVKWFPK
jgi:hypothetical protein